jgi:hypothetical protein
VVQFAWLGRLDSWQVRYLSAGGVRGLCKPAWQDFNSEIKLLGYRLEKPDRLTLYWQAERPPAADYRVLILLQDPHGQVLETIDNKFPGHNLASRWEAGQIVRDEYTLPLDPARRPIVYQLAVALVGPASQERLPLTDSPVAGTTAAPLTALAQGPSGRPSLEGAQAVGTRFGSIMELAQARVPAEMPVNGRLEFTLAWKSLQRTATDYTVFVHLLKPDGTLADVQDSQPRTGLYPTSFWTPGEVIIDERGWQPQVPAGEYLLEIGLYDLKSQQRLPTSGPHSELGDRLILGTVHVKE